MIRRLTILLLIVGCEETLEPEACTGVNDIDDNCYQTVQIGELVWMKQNPVIHLNYNSFYYTFRNSLCNGLQ